jgi:hypothetical protein
MKIILVPLADLAYFPAQHGRKILPRLQTKIKSYFLLHTIFTIQHRKSRQPANVEKM